MVGSPFPGRRAAAALAATALAALALAGCGTTDRIVASSVPIADYRTRHPIVLAEARTSIDVFPSWIQHGLDTHTARQVYAFAGKYRDTGHGPGDIMLPRGLPPG